MKDDIESFKYVERELNVTSGEILHVGDALSCDYIKPKEAGWNSLFYGETDKLGII